MVQLLAGPVASLNAKPIHDVAEGWSSCGGGMQDSLLPPRGGGQFFQPDRDLEMKRLLRTAPARGRSMTMYRDDNTRSLPLHGAAARPMDRPDRIPEHAVLPSSILLSPSLVILVPGDLVSGKPVKLARRPKAPPPRRSYSMTDKEPEVAAPGLPRPSTRMTLLDLPSELHYSLFDFLDPIDGVCLGLAHSRLYAIHRRKYGKVPLSSRYAGPNDMEWAWRGAGPLIRSCSHPSGRNDDLARLRVKGQVYCRKCGISRCELHRHLKGWMGDGYEYCEVRKTYGKPANGDAKPYCFRKSPKDPHRCGRHGGKPRSMSDPTRRTLMPLGEVACN